MKYTLEKNIYNNSKQRKYCDLLILNNSSFPIFKIFMLVIESTFSNFSLPITFFLSLEKNCIFNFSHVYALDISCNLNASVANIDQYLYKGNLMYFNEIAFACNAISSSNEFTLEP